MLIPLVLAILMLMLYISRLLTLLLMPSLPHVFPKTLKLILLSHLIKKASLVIKWACLLLKVILLFLLATGIIYNPIPLIKLNLMVALLSFLTISEFVIVVVITSNVKPILINDSPLFYKHLKIRKFLNFSFFFSFIYRL